MSTGVPCLGCEAVLVKIPRSIVALLLASVAVEAQSTGNMRGWELGVRAGSVSGGDLSVAPNYPLTGETAAFANNKCYPSCTYRTAAGTTWGVSAQFTGTGATSVGVALDSHGIGSGVLKPGRNGPTTPPRSNDVRLWTAVLTVKPLIRWPSSDFSLRPGVGIGLGALPASGASGYSRHFVVSATLEVLPTTQSWLVEIGALQTQGGTSSSNWATHESINLSGRAFARVGWRFRPKR